MADLQPLVDYLKIDRRSDEAQAKDIYTEAYVLDAQYDASDPLENTTLEILKTTLKNTAKCRPISDMLDVNANVDLLYLDILDSTDQSESFVYYQKREYVDQTQTIIRYKPIIGGQWSVLDDSGFIEIPLVNHSTSYYYYRVGNRVIEANALDTVFVFPDQFSYDPSQIPKISDGDYELSYTDHEGYDTSAGDQALKFLLDPLLKIIRDRMNRSVVVNRSEAKGEVNLYPYLIQRDNRYVVKYLYPDKTFSVLGLRFLNSAIKLKFRDLGAMLEFLNQTIFDSGDFDSLTDDSGIRQYFFDQYTGLLQNELMFSRDHIDEVLKILYYAPKVFLMRIDTDTLWDIVGEAIEQNLTNIGLNKEDVVLILLQVLSEKTATKTIFLEELLIRKVKSNKSFFKVLYSKTNGDNFVKYVQFLYDIWRESTFTQIDHPKYATFDGPLLLPYKSDTFIGFYYSNTDINFEKDNTLDVDLETGEYVYQEYYSPSQKGNVIKKKEIVLGYTYHPFQPIYLLEPAKKTSITLPKIVPAFFLKANEDKSFWSNVITGIEYGVDIITTLSGVGNIAKFRHLAKVAQVASRISKGTQVARFASVISKIRLAAGAIEISSGTINALIKLTEVKDTELGKTISEVLFWIELASLGGEVTAAIKNGLRNSAKKALKQREKLEKLRESVSNAEDAKDIDQVTKLLNELAETGLKGGDNGDITKSFFKNAGIEIEEIVSSYTVTGQTTEYTCAASSLRMILNDSGRILSESYLARALDTTEEGASILDIPRALDSVYVNLNIISRGGRKDNISIRALEKLFKKQNRKAIVSVSTEKFGSHAIIIDKIEGGKVFIRDPLPLYQGSSYVVSLQDFKKVFNRKFVLFEGE